MSEGTSLAVCVSYPKSGRTWLRTMFSELGAQVTFTHLDTGHNYSAWGKLPENLKKPSVDANRVIFLYRDPRDTVVSYFYETTIRQKPDRWRAIKFWLGGRNAPQKMRDLVRSRRFGIEKVIHFNLLCAEHLNALPVSYEELSSDTLPAMKRILSFMDFQVSDERLAEVVANNSFSKMHEREATGGYARGGLQPRDVSNPNSYKVRKGKVGGWEEEMDDETKDFVGKKLNEARYFGRMQELLSNVKA